MDQRDRERQREPEGTEEETGRRRDRGRDESVVIKLGRTPGVKRDRERRKVLDE